MRRAKKAHLVSTEITLIMGLHLGVTHSNVLLQKFLFHFENLSADFVIDKESKINCIARICFYHLYMIQANDWVSGFLYFVVQPDRNLEKVESAISIILKRTFCFVAGGFGIGTTLRI